MSALRHDKESNHGTLKSARCPLYPRKRTFCVPSMMSALCQKQTFRHSCDHLAWARATCAFALFLSITMSDEPIKLSLIKSKTLVVTSEVRPADGGQEFMARHGILSKYAQHLTGHHGHFAFVNTPRGHAFMNRLDHYGDTERL